jgi:hypothetical protein
MIHFVLIDDIDPNKIDKLDDYKVDNDDDDE